jgi:hypothetical protein
MNKKSKRKRRMNKRSMRKINIRKRRISRRSMRKISMINLFLFMKINGYLYHQRVSPPLKTPLKVLTDHSN